MMYLLDTHTALWLFEGSEKLSHAAQEAIFSIENEVFISIASAWEIAIKVSLNKLDFEGGSKEFLNAIEANNINLLGITGNCIAIVEEMPYFHRDPFDRIIIASALSEGMTIITADKNIGKYAASCIW